ncbi:hypothetical protein [Bifidobacterium cuniculi]|uniref:Uncharacterized protein n=1 Tax=Bifidobacterium cuniculi TaxID=1688 RepID=A0A087B507_9BIFI|nr:hypothetical protein [Bifidobacterium cuniculi]KFI66107.1 hypothetical protein BCUN_0611 [Bifidobacterium cuniculi]
MSDLEPYEAIETIFQPLIEDAMQRAAEHTKNNPYEIPGKPFSLERLILGHLRGYAEQYEFMWYGHRNGTGKSLVELKYDATFNELFVTMLEARWYVRRYDTSHAIWDDRADKIAITRIWARMREIGAVTVPRGAQAITRKDVDQ